MKSNICSNIQRILYRLVDRYNKQRIQKIADKQIILGRNQSISSSFELDFANYLFKNSKLKVLVDYPISNGSYTTKTGKSRTKILYPDIIVLDDNALKGIIELKLDLGYLNVGYYGLEEGTTESWEYCGNSNFKKFYSNLLSLGDFTYNYPVGFTHAKKVKVIIPDNSEKIIKICIVVTKQNDHGRFDAFKKSMIDSGFQFLHLLDEIHPNERIRYKLGMKKVDILQRIKMIKKGIKNELKNKENIIEQSLGKLF